MTRFNSGWIGADAAGDAVAEADIGENPCVMKIAGASVSVSGRQNSAIGQHGSARKFAIPDM
jgi:hypothetical protein